jgi:DNA-binding MarR family transcriptional regulator
VKRRSAQGEPAEAPLSDQERQLMRILARADGAAVHFETAGEQLGVSRLILQTICESLSRRGLIEPSNHTVWGLHIVLTREGRDFVIKEGFVR